MVKIGAVIVAGGSGTRMGGTVKKQFMQIDGKEIFAIAVEKFEKSNLISQIIIVTPADCITETIAICQKNNWKKVGIAIGGKQRKNSVYNGLVALEKDTEIVLIHDGVRPFVKDEEISRVVEKVKKTGAAVLAVHVKDTIKICENGIIKDTPQREDLWAMQTPQGFDYKKIIEAYEKFGEEINATDDAMLMEAMGVQVFLVEGSYENIKITTPEDMAFAQVLAK